MYQSFSSLTIPRATPRDSQVITAQVVGFSPNLLCRGEGLGFWNGKISYSFERKMQDFSIFFSKNREQLEKQVFLCCFMSIFAKTVDVYCIFNNIDHFLAISVILTKFSGHPRVIFANARSSLKFWVLYIARFVVNGLFQGYSSGYSWSIASMENHMKSWFEFFGSYYLLRSYFGTCS